MIIINQNKYLCLEFNLLNLSCIFPPESIKLNIIVSKCKKKYIIKRVRFNPKAEVYEYYVEKKQIPDVVTLNVIQKSTWNFWWIFS